MSISIAEFARELASAEYTFSDGRKFGIRALSGREEHAIKLIRPRPTPPKKPPGGMGSLAEPVTDTTDGAYQEQVHGWLFWVEVLTVAVSAEFVPHGGARFNATAPPAENRAWADAAFAEISGRMTADEIGSIYMAIEGLNVSSLLGKSGADSSSSANNPGPKTSMTTSPPPTT